MSPCSYMSAAALQLPFVLDPYTQSLAFIGSAVFILVDSLADFVRCRVFASKLSP